MWWWTIRTMRGFSIWCMLALAVMGRAEEEQVAQGNDIATLEDEDVVARTFTDAMFDREKEERAVKVEPEDQARYDKFIDTSIEPLASPITNKKAKSGPQTRLATFVKRKNGKELRSALTIGPVDPKVNQKFGTGKSGVVRSARPVDPKVNQKFGTGESGVVRSARPVDPKVNQKFGTGKSGVVRSARPVDPKVNQKFGTGKSGVVRSAPELTGQMNLYVPANGKANITKFTIARPRVYPYKR